MVGSRASAELYYVRVTCTNTDYLKKQDVLLLASLHVYNKAFINCLFTSMVPNFISCS